MTTPTPLRFTLRNNQDQTFTILDAGSPIYTGSLEDCYRRRGQMELAARPAAVVSERKQRRLNQIREAKQGGIR